MFKQATQKVAPGTGQTSKKKKKNKDKKKEAVTAAGGNITPPQTKSRNHSPEQSKVQQAKAPEPQKLATSTSQKTLDPMPPKANSGTSQPVQQAPIPTPQLTSQASASKRQKALQEQLLDNFQELTKKYQELSQKFQKVQDQLANQADKQIELEKTISQNLQKYLPTLVEQQMRDQVVPMVLQHVKSVDRKVKDEILPAIEGQLHDIVVKLVRQNKLTLNNDGNGSQEGQAGVGKFILDSNAQNAIRQVVVDEFASSMDQVIRPVLQEQLASVIKDAQVNLIAVTAEFSNRLNQEELRNQEIVEKITEKVE